MCVCVWVCVSRLLFLKEEEVKRRAQRRTERKFSGSSPVSSLLFMVSDSPSSPTPVTVGNGRQIQAVHLHAVNSKEENSEQEKLSVILGHTLAPYLDMIDV